MKILVPTWIFISLGYILIYQEKTVTVLEVLQWLICTFNGYGSLPGIGASWYVFIVMWCYLMTPFIIRFLNRLEKCWQGKEFSFYLKALFTVCVLGGIYRVVSYFFLDWYNWTYANVLGCIDLFIAGIIAFRMTFFLPQLSVRTISLFRKISDIGLLILILLCIEFGSLIPYGGFFYKYVWPSAYLILTCAILVAYSYKSGANSTISTLTTTGQI